MASIHALTNQARTSSHRAPFTQSSVEHEAYYVEDGWVFREHHGKYVECICRTEEMGTTTLSVLPSAKQS